MKTLLFKPFEKYSENKLLSIGFLAMLLGIYLASTFNMRFDGVLDLHASEEVSMLQAFLDSLIDITILVLFLFLGAKYSNSKTRFVDLITTVIIARIPLYFLSFGNWNNSLYKAGEVVIQQLTPEAIAAIPSATFWLLAVFSILSIIGLIWYISLLFNGFKTASNAKGKKAIYLFIGALIIAEIFSKIGIYLVNEKFL